MSTWHRDFPPAAQEMWDVLAKSLMLRAGDSVTLSKEEIRAAASTFAEIAIHADGSISFRVERN